MATPARPPVPGLGVAAAGTPSAEALDAAGHTTPGYADFDSFVEPEAGRFHADFQVTADNMSPLVRRALVDDEVDEDDTALVQLLGHGRLGSTRRLLRRKGAIRPSGCAALRALVDVERDVRRDSVDQKPQHQLNIKIDRLTELIGFEDIKQLWRLADEVLSMQREEARATSAETGAAIPAETVTQTEAAAGGYTVDMFVRRYTRETRPWINFHHDISNVTVNVALSADADHEGGRLHALIGGRHTALSREEGEATVHGDDVMHAVSAMRGGVRYSLIMFFYTLQDNAEGIVCQTIPMLDIWHSGSYPYTLGDEVYSEPAQHEEIDAAAEPAQQSEGDGSGEEVHSCSKGTGLFRGRACAVDTSGGGRNLAVLRVPTVSGLVGAAWEGPLS